MQKSCFDLKNFFKLKMFSLSKHNRNKVNEVFFLSKNRKEGDQLATLMGVTIEAPLTAEYSVRAKINVQ